MKKIFAFVLAACLAFSLTACSIPGMPFGQKTSEPVQTSEPVTVPDFSDEEPTPSEDPEATTAPEVTVAPEATQQPTETSTGDNVDAAQSSVENPVPLNTWAGISKYSAKADGYYTVNVRVTGVVTDAAQIQAMVDEHNKFASEWEVLDLTSEDLQLPSDVQWCAVTYEVRIPEDFPSESWGISSPEITWDSETSTGGGIPSADGTTSYIGLGMAYDQLYTAECNSDTTYLPGNTYVMANLYPMVKGYTDYVFRTNYVLAGQDIDNGGSVDAFFAIS